MKFDPKWLHALQHALSKELGKCKSCGESHKKLYHCKNCMVGIYCSSQCQSLDNEHPCLIAKRGRDGEGREAAGGPPAQRRRTEERQLGTLAAFPRDILVLLLTYLNPKDISSVNQVSRALNQLIMDHPDQLPSIPIQLSVEQMYRFPVGIKPRIRNLTITNSERMTVEQLAYLVREFPRLRVLGLLEYQGDNIEPLRDLRYLRVLVLASYQGNNIEPLHNLRDLRELYLNFYHGETIEPLSGLGNLQMLDLEAYQGETIEPLRDLVNLQNLNLSSYQGDNIEPLRGLVNLRALYLWNYQGDNIEPLRGLVSLQNLNLFSYDGDLGPLRNLDNLQTLVLRNHPDQAAVRALKRELGIE